MTQKVVWHLVKQYATKLDIAKLAPRGLRLVVRPVCALDTVVGADGIHSVVREIRLGREEPHFTRRVAYRTTFPAARRGELKLDGNTKWWALTCGPWWPYPMGPREA